MDHVCRVCTASSVTLVDLFAEPERSSDQPSLLEVLKECVGGEIDNNDLLPKEICEICADAAQNAFRFKRKYQESQRRFYQLLEGNNENSTDIHGAWPFAECGVNSFDEDSIDEKINEYLKSISDNIRVQTESNSSNTYEATSEDSHYQDNCESSDKPKKIEPNPSKKHLCESCGKVFPRSEHLKIHMRLHTGERPYKCSECNATFVQRRTLEDHTRVHKGENPFKCTICPRAFVNKSNLVSHIRVHSGERPYKCSQCEKTFIQSGCLQTHLRVHTGERPYKCLQCQKAFSNNSSLQKHMRIHSGERPYKCTNCPKAFTRKETFENHIILHSGKRSYKCPQCPKDFYTHGRLKRHSIVHSPK